VLGNKVIALRRTLDWLPQSDPLWTTSETNIYLNGEQIAFQWGAERTTNKSVGFTYQNPVIGSANSSVFDPTGAEVALTDPGQEPPPPLDPPQHGSLNDFSGGCYVDGVRTTCDFALRLTNSGAGRVASIDTWFGFAPGVGPAGAIPVWDVLRWERGQNGDSGTNIIGLRFAFYDLQGGGQQQRGETDCSRFVGSIVNSVEVGIGFSTPPSLIFSTASVVGHSLLQMAREHSARLGNPDHTVVGFRPELTDIQEDGVYQHVAAHAGATVIGHNKLWRSVNNGTTGNKKATTGYELTDFALQEDERQLRTATNPERRRENASEINDDHAGRLIGGDINRRINGEITKDQLREAIFGRLCQ